MTSKETADRWLQTHTVIDYTARVETINALSRLIDKQTEEANANQREKLAGWMLANGIATGHGDTIEDLLDELTQQIMAAKRHSAR